MGGAKDAFFPSGKGSSDTLDVLKGAVGDAAAGKRAGDVAAPPPAPEMQDAAIRNAKLMERRRQLGLQGRGATWLTGARGDTTPVVSTPPTLLGG